MPTSTGTTSATTQTLIDVTMKRKLMWRVCWETILIVPGNPNSERFPWSLQIIIVVFVARERENVVAYEQVKNIDLLSLSLSFSLPPPLSLSRSSQFTPFYLSRSFSPLTTPQSFRFKLLSTTLSHALSLFLVSLVPSLSNITQKLRSTCRHLFQYYLKKPIASFSNKT